MGQLLLRVKLLPNDVGVDLTELADSVRRALPDGSRVRSAGEEPIAFGVKALLLDVETEEKDGATDAVENALREVPKVSHVQVLGVSRLSTRLH